MFNRNSLKAGYDAHKTNQGKHSVFLVACAAWERWRLVLAVLLMHESKEAKLTHLRRGITPCLMGMGLSHRFARALAVCLEPDTRSSPLTCFSHRVTKMGGRAVPSTGSSLPVMFVTNCKDHGPVPTDSLWHLVPWDFSGSLPVWHPSSAGSPAKANQGLCSISTGAKRLQKSGKTKISTLTRNTLTFF